MLELFFLDVIIISSSKNFLSKKFQIITVLHQAEKKCGNIF